MSATSGATAGLGRLGRLLGGGALGSGVGGGAGGRYARTDNPAVARGVLSAAQATFLLRRMEEAGPLSYREPRPKTGSGAGAAVTAMGAGAGGIPDGARARLKRKLVQRLSGAIVSAASLRDF